MDLIFRNVRIDDAQPLMDVAVHNGHICLLYTSDAADERQYV